MMTWMYRIFGLNILSEIELPGRAAGHHVRPDVTVRWGELNESALGTPDALHVSIDGVAEYGIFGGSRIVVDPRMTRDAAEIRLFLTGSALGALLHQRGTVPLHASSVAVGRQCVAFAGESGAGKSTLVSFLQGRGYPMLCDDVMPVEIGEPGDVVVRPGLARVKLWSDSMKSLHFDTGAAERLRAGYDKFEVSVAVPSDCAHSLCCLYILRETDREDEEGIVPVDSMHGLQLLLSNTYRPDFITAVSGETSHFRACSAVLQRVSVRYFTRHKAWANVDRHLDMLEADFAAQGVLPELAEAA